METNPSDIPWHVMYGRYATPRVIHELQRLHTDATLPWRLHDFFVPMQTVSGRERLAPGSYIFLRATLHDIQAMRTGSLLSTDIRHVRSSAGKPMTTDSSHDYPLYPDLIRDYLPDAPCRLYVSDITYIPYWLDPETGEYRFCYLALVTDSFTKEIVGYKVAPTLEAKYAIEALEMALAHGNAYDLTKLIHHSDRGVQYASYAYTDILKSHGISISMTESGNPKDNAVAERVNNTIKNELLKGMQFSSIDEVKTAVDAAVDFYNNERPHLSLDGMTPSEAASCKGEIHKRWVSYREKAIKSKRV